MKIIGATIGNCVHVNGLMNFLKYAKEFGHRTKFIGVGLSGEEIISKIRKEECDVVALSYRLSSETAENIFKDIDILLKKEKIKDVKFIFGGTESVCKVARRYKFFDYVIADKKNMEEFITFLSGKKGENKQQLYPQNLVERIEHFYPYPLIRHHFGRPLLAETISGAKEIAAAKVVDILSIGPDQNAQEFFFKPKEMLQSLNGAGGVPLRKPDDLKKIYTAIQCGNYPLLRCYSGTNHLKKWAQLLHKTINICFGAVPLTFYSEIDKRSKRNLFEAIKENIDAIRYYTSLDIPIEINESHQWALRGAKKEVEVASAYLTAYIAKKLGVKNFIQQYMFNVPKEISISDDIVKMFAKMELVESLKGKKFNVLRMTRTGIASMPQDFDKAKGHLSSSLTIQMLLQPHIVHIVGFSEADHAIKTQELIESCNIAKGVIEYCLNQNIDGVLDTKRFKKKKEEIKNKAMDIFEKIKKSGDPVLPETIEMAVKKHILYAPQVFI